VYNKSPVPLLSYRLIPQTPKVKEDTSTVQPTTPRPAVTFCPELTLPLELDPKDGCPAIPFPVERAPLSIVALPTLMTEVAKVAVAESALVDSLRAESVRKTTAADGALRGITQVLAPVSH
jgi:hypothetical protein